MIVFECPRLFTLPGLQSSHSTESRRLILDRKVTPRPFLILTPNEIRNLLVLGLLDGGLVALIPLSQTVLLYCVDSLKRDVNICDL